MEFLKEYTLASLRLKKEKWKKIIISDEQKEYLINFIESDYPDFMVLSQNVGGHLQIHVDWPSQLKHKGKCSLSILSRCDTDTLAHCVGVYFVKREAQPLPEGENINYANHLAWGDIHPNVLGNKSGNSARPCDSCQINQSKINTYLL